MDKMPTLVELIGAGCKIPPIATIKRDMPKFGRNKPCFCGSGIKYKKCCLILEIAVSQMGREQSYE